jgi:hypothetical protein
LKISVWQEPQTFEPAYRTPGARLRDGGEAPASAVDFTGVVCGPTTTGSNRNRNRTTGQNNAVERFRRNHEQFNEALLVRFEVAVQSFMGEAQ